MLIATALAMAVFLIWLDRTRKRTAQRGQGPPPLSPEAPGGKVRPSQGVGVEEQSKRCPACAESVQGAAVICRFCGHDFRSAGVPPARVAQRNGANPDLSKVGGFAVLGSALLIAAGSILPWVTVSGGVSVSVNGFETKGFGAAFLVLALVMGLVGLQPFITAEIKKRTGVLASLGAVLGLFVLIAAWGVTDNRVSEAEAAGFVASTGSGIFVILLGLAIGLAGGALLEQSARRSRNS